MLIGPPIPEMQLFKKMTLKIHVKVMDEVKVQNHNVSLTSYRLTSLSFHGNLATHGWVTTHIPFGPRQWALPFLNYDFFKIWPWKSKVKVMDEVTVQSHNVGLTSYRLTSLLFHVNRPSHSWITAFSKFDLENQGSRSWVRSQFKVTMWV